MLVIFANHKLVVAPVATSSYLLPSTFHQTMAIIKHVMASATEAKLTALYIVACEEAVYIRIILEEMVHKQPATPLQPDNSMAEAVVICKIQPNQTKD